MQSLATASFVAAAILGAHAQSTIEDALSQSYAPVYVDCPADIQWIRPATSLSSNEASWVHEKKKNVLCALETYLENLGLEDFDLPQWVAHMLSSNYTDVPTLSMAISGGGYASAFTGVGAFRALDSRLDAANDAKTGGLLQSMTYITGQSGGSWPIIGLSTFNFPTVDELVFDNWKPWIDRFDNTDNTSTNAGTPESLFGDVTAKALAGFNVGVADYFGRAYGYEFLPGANGGLGFTYSNITNQSNFLNHQMPFPILLTTALDSQDTEYFGLEVPYSNSTIYEMTPWEFGNWDGPVPGFTPMEYVGTLLENGSVVNESACVRGFDKASYILGTAASAFNFWVIEANSNDTEAPFSKSKRSLSSTLVPRSVTFPEAEIEALIEAFQEYFNLNLTDIVYATWPNPFAGLPSPSSATIPPENLNLVDTSEVGQGIPLWPLIQPVRSPSLIFAWEDNGGDAAPYSWTNGTNLYDTYLAANASGLAFPIIPPATTMLNLNMTIQPTFFGCDTALTTTPNTADSPIILYLANAPYSAYTNISWTQTATSSAQMWEILVNSFDLVTAGNGTLDSEWPACIGCAVIERSLEGVGLQRSSQCERCFEKYCWNGTYDDSSAGILDPSLRLDPGLGFVEWNLTNPFTDSD